MIKKIIKKALGIQSGPSHPYAHLVTNEDFIATYNKGIERTNTPPSLWRRDRFFHLWSALAYTHAHTEGAVADVGVWRGLSSFTLCTGLKKENPTFDGKNYFAIDSFEGLSAPTQSDGTLLLEKGAFASSMEEVKKTLSDFPNIQYVRGWVPDILASLPELHWRLVHVDLDLIEPTLGAFRYFYPRLLDGGMIICDDYGSKAWPNLKKAVDAFVLEHKLKAIPLSTGQLMIVK